MHYGLPIETVTFTIYLVRPNYFLLPINSRLFHFIIANKHKKKVVRLLLLTALRYFRLEIENKSNLLISESKAFLKYTSQEHTATRSTDEVSSRIVPLGPLLTTVYYDVIHSFIHSLFKTV